MSLAVKLGLPKRCTCRHPKQYRIFCDECSSEDRKKIAAYRKQCTKLTKGQASSLNRKRRLAEQSDGSVSISDLKKMRQDADKCPYCLKAMIDSDKHSVVDCPCYKPHGYSLLVGDLNRSVYGKLPKEWGEFPPLTVLMAANAIKGKVDKYLSTQENLDKILREVE